MKRIVITAILVFSVAAVAATASAGSDATKNASVSCTALKAKMGATAFSQAYATFGACVSSMVSLEQQNVNAATAACTAEKNDPNFATSHNGQTFDQFYGAGKKSRNAFASCVSTKAKASSVAEGQVRPNPSRTCRSQRTQMGLTAFTSAYGGHRNAFGKCVSNWAHTQTNNELSAAAACRTEQADANFAATHSGKTFAQAYGTGDLSNAFGKCVAAKASEKTQAQISAAKACGAELRASATTFKATYGTFGHCVSVKAHSK